MMKIPSLFPLYIPSNLYGYKGIQSIVFFVLKATIILRIPFASFSALFKDGILIFRIITGGRERESIIFRWVLYPRRHIQYLF